MSAWPVCPGCRQSCTGKYLGAHGCSRCGSVVYSAADAFARAVRYVAPVKLVPWTPPSFANRGGPRGKRRAA